MKNILKGDKIYAPQSDTIHLVDAVETIEGYELVFTEDKKCFQSHKVRKTLTSFFDFVDRKLIGEELSQKELDSLVETYSSEFKSFEAVRYDINLFVQTGILVRLSPTC